MASKTPLDDTVAAPRSKGCRACVMRRIKCDLARPHCLRCIKGHRSCPGYSSTQHTFVDEGPKLRRHQRSNITSAQSQARQPAISPSTATPSTEGNVHSFFDGGAGTRRTSLDEDLLSLDLQESSASAFVTSALLSMTSPSAYQAQLLSQLIGTLSPARRGSLVSGNHSWNSFLRHLACHPASSPVLDSAIRALTLSHLGLNFESTEIVLHARQHYGKALARLNATLQSPSEGLSTETLIATVLLSFYEIIICTESRSWTRHACGVSRLLRLRGPELHREGIGRSAMNAFHSFLIVEAMIDRQPCFLDSPDWRSMLDETAQSLPDPLERAMEAFYRESAAHPGFYRAVTNLSSSTSTRSLRRLMQRGRELRAGWKEAYSGMINVLREEGLEPIETTSKTGDTMFPIIYEYPSTYVGCHCCGYWTNLSILNQMLISIDRRLQLAIVAERASSDGSESLSSTTSDDGSHFTSAATTDCSDDTPRQKQYELECIENSRKTCKSAEHLSTYTNAFLAPTYLIFALRNALKFLVSEQEQAWIGAQLQRISHNMALARFTHFIVTSGRESD